MKLFARVGIAAFLAVCVMMWAGCSWAEEEPQSPDENEEVGYYSRINLMHHTNVKLGDNGEPQYDSTWFEGLFLGFMLGTTGIQNEDSFPAWPNSGEIAIVPEAELAVRYYDVQGSSEWSPQSYSEKQAVSFDLYSYNESEGWVRWYDLASADVDGEQRAFFMGDGVEEALSEASYTFKFNSDISGSGKFPEIIKTSADYTGDGRVPYIQPVFNGGKIDKLKYGFVDPATKDFAENEDSEESAIRIRTLEIFLTDGNSLYSTINTDGENWATDESGSGWYDGAEHELPLTTITPIELKKIGSLRIGFDYPREVSETEDVEDDDDEDSQVAEDGNITATSSIFYYWNFNNESAERDNQEPTIIQVPEEELNAVDAASNDLKVPVTEIVPISSDADIRTNTAVEFNDTGITQDRTVSAISVAQTVKEGGAVVLGSNLKLPVNSNTIGDYVTLDPPKNFEELRSKYKVLKGFRGGYTIDLLARFGEYAFSYDGDGSPVTLTAAIVIIDDAAPNDDPRIVKPFSSALFGVMSGDLQGGGKVLYIYDGEQNSKAEDPIALVANEDQVPDAYSPSPSKPSNPPADSQPAGPDDELPDDSAPPEGEATTKVSIDLNPNSEDKGIVRISVSTLDGRPIPAGIPFRVWLLPSQNTAKAAASYIGPFVVESGEGGVLEIDVNNLKTPDGNKATISKGSYVIKFSDDEGKYIGTTPAIELEATGTQTPPVDEDNEKTGGGSGGGCNAGYGLFGLLLAGFAAWRFRRA
jgi:hypothetical protein